VAAALGALTGWLLFATLVLVLGSLAGRWLLLPRIERASDNGSPGAPPDGPWPGSSAVPPHLVEAASRLGFFASLTLPLAIALVFVRQLHEFRDPFVPWQEDASLLIGTEWGRTWIGAAAAAVAAPIVFALCRLRIRGAWPLATLIVLTLALFPSLTGHAAGTQALRPFTLAADSLHVVAAGAWMGGLALVLYAERRWRGVYGSGSVLPVLVPAFSPVAIGCVLVLIGTGLFASWIHLDGVSALAFTPYGRLLLLKLGLVAVALGLGARNWRVLTPRLHTPGGPAALRRTGLTELVVAQLVLLVTAVLVRTSP